MASLSNKFDKMERDDAAKEAEAKKAQDAAMKAAAVESDRIWSTSKVGPNGQTQAQLDAEAGQKAAAEARAYAESTRQAGLTAAALAEENRIKAAVKAAEDKRIAAVKAAGGPKGFIWDNTSKSYVMPAEPDTGTWQWDNVSGKYVSTAVVPGYTGFQAVDVPGKKDITDKKTLAINTFKNTLALYIGAKEISKPYVDALYKTVNDYYETGSTFDEAINLTVQEARHNPLMAEFTKRFAGLYALTDRLAGNEALVTPTVAEWVKSEAAVGEVLTRAGMGELATQEFAGKVLGLNKSVSEIATLINDTFYRIDNAPKDLKDTLETHFGSLSRVDLAKALLMGKEGAVELDNKIKGLSVLSAAGTQGSVIDYATASDIAKQGFGYKESLAGFGKVKELRRGKDLGNIYGEQVSDKDTRDAVFGQNADALAKLDRLGRQEDASFSGKSGMTASALRASRTV